LFEPRHVTVLFCRECEDAPQPCSGMAITPHLRAAVSPRVRGMKSDRRQAIHGGVVVNVVPSVTPAHRHAEAFWRLFRKRAHATAR